MLDCESLFGTIDCCCMPFGGFDYEIDLYMSGNNWIDYDDLKCVVGCF